MKVTKAMAKIIPPEKCYNVRVINNIELVVNFLDYFLLTFSCFTFTMIKKQNKMELLQSQAPLDRELSGSSASARHGTFDIGH